jgi:hypothetical protein
MVMSSRIVPFVVAALATAVCVVTVSSSGMFAYVTHQEAGM